MHMGETEIAGDSLIMIVDDNEPVAEVLSAILRSMGFSSMEFSYGFDAIGSYRDSWKEISLVILDLNMPGINGREVFSRLREVNPDVDVILISGRIADGEIGFLLEKGAKGFVQKPFSLDVLSKQILEIIEDEGSPQQELAGKR